MLGLPANCQSASGCQAHSHVEELTAGAAIDVTSIMPVADIRREVGSWAPKGDSDTIANDFLDAKELRELRLCRQHQRTWVFRWRRSMQKTYTAISELAYTALGYEHIHSSIEFKKDIGIHLHATTMMPAYMRLFGATRA